METYRHSGAISPAGILLASMTGIMAALVLGVAYDFAVVYIPYVYLRALLTFCFGWFMGRAVGWGAKTGKIRNTFVATAYGLIVGLIGLYIAWGTDFFTRVIMPMGGGIDDFFFGFSPAELSNYIQAFYVAGAWSLKGGDPVTGIPLASVWAIEATIIVGASTYFARSQIANLPFCESCRCWTAITPGKRHLSLVEAGEHLSQLLAGDLTALVKFNIAQLDSTFLQLDLAQCPTCTDSVFLTIQQVTQTVDKEGKLKTEIKSLVRNMLIAAEDVPLVENAGQEPPPEAVSEEFVDENTPESGQTPKIS